MQSLWLFENRVSVRQMHGMHGMHGQQQEKGKTTFAITQGKSVPTPLFFCDFFFLSCSVLQFVFWYLLAYSQDFKGVVTAKKEEREDKVGRRKTNKHKVGFSIKESNMVPLQVRCLGWIGLWVHTNTRSERVNVCLCSFHFLCSSMSLFLFFFLIHPSIPASYQQRQTQRQRQRHVKQSNHFAQGISCRVYMFVLVLPEESIRERHGPSIGCHPRQRNICVCGG